MGAKRRQDIRPAGIEHIHEQVLEFEMIEASELHRMPRGRCVG